MNRRAALTLLELVVAMGLLSLVLLAFSFLFASLLRSSVSNSERLEGLTVTQSIFEAVRATKEFPATSGNLTITLYNGDASSPAQYIYSVQSTPVSGVPHLYQVDVDCWWNQGSSSPGKGPVHLRMERLMSP